MAYPVVAIVGRPNVGKSTIFNRLVGERLAIVEDEPGITRDRLISRAEWLGRTFQVIDTGGIEITNDEDHLMRSMRMQAELAMDESDVVVLLVDGKMGLMDSDREVAQMLYRIKKPVVVAVNKMDNPQMLDNRYEFYELGLGEPIAVSGAHAIGIGDLLDAVVEHFPEDIGDEYEEDVIKIAVIGRPNVGKSSMVNSIVGYERVIVSEIAGTTRDAIDTPFERDGQKYVIIDTAGMRKKGKVYESVEKYSVMRALAAIDRADVALIVLNAEEGIIEQDKHIAGYAHEAGKASIFVINKWDAIEKDDKTMQRFVTSIEDHFLFMNYAPVETVSAKTKQRLQKLFPTIQRVSEQQNLRIPTSTLNEIIQDAIVRVPPPMDKGRRLRIQYVTQVSVKPPMFVMFVNDPELLHFSYQRYIENKIRERFPFEGTPIRFSVRRKDE